MFIDSINQLTGMIIAFDKIRSQLNCNILDM